MVKFSLKTATILAAIGPLLIWGGITSAPAAEPFTIGVSNGALASSFRTQMIDDLNETNKEYESAGVTKPLIVLSADVPVQGQIQQMRNLIARKVNGIIIDPNSATALNPVLREAVEAGIIVVSVDQDVTEPSGDQCPYRSCRLGARACEVVCRQPQKRGNDYHRERHRGKPSE